MKEQVNHPQHYNKGNIECITAMLSSKGLFRTIVFCDTNTFKYNWRQGQKDDVIQDIQKQNWYLNKQIELIDNCINSNEKAKRIYKKIVALCDELDTTMY